jgi:hypothetical protein
VDWTTGIVLKYRTEKLLFVDQGQEKAVSKVLRFLWQERDRTKESYFLFVGVIAFFQFFAAKKLSKLLGGTKCLDAKILPSMGTLKIKIFTYIHLRSVFFYSCADRLLPPRCLIRNGKAIILAPDLEPFFIL